jgi:hypothetical protein
MYRVRIDAFGQLIDEPVTITRGQTTALELNVTGDKVTVRR